MVGRSRTSSQPAASHHSEIERLGFLDYVNGVATKPSDMLFPELKPGGPDAKVGYDFTKW